MVRRNRDAKFIIYQVLYIFVITVLALKGAEINLGEVVEKDNVVEKSVRDSLVNVVDSLSLLGLKFNIELDTSVIVENLILKNKLKKLNSQVASLSNKIKKSPIAEEKGETKIKKSAEISPFSKNITFLQFAINTVENKSNEFVSIIDPLGNIEIAKIPPKNKGSFELQSQNSLLIKYGDYNDRIKVTENRPPEIFIEKVTTQMDKPYIYVKELQRTTCFNVYVTDERLEQLKISYSGPISVSGPKKDNKGNLVYKVSLNLAANEDQFEKWVDRNEFSQDSEDRYKTNFFFKAYDTRSNQKVEVGESFYFTDFSK